MGLLQASLPLLVAAGRQRPVQPINHVHARPPVRPPPQQALILPPASWGVSLDWTDEEQRALEAAMAQFPPERASVAERYIKIAAMLPRKSVRDVALRARWTLQQQLRKGHLGPGGLPLPAGAGGGVGGAAAPELGGPGGVINGPIGQLLESNFAILNTFRANMAAFKARAAAPP